AAPAAAGPARAPMRGPYSSKKGGAGAGLFSGGFPRLGPGATRSEDDYGRLGVGGGGDELRVTRRQRRVAAARQHEVVVPALLDDSAVVENDDLVGVAHGREPVRNRNRRPALGQTIERFLDEPLRLAVERARRLVYDA